MSFSCAGCGAEPFGSHADDCPEIAVSAPIDHVGDSNEKVRDDAVALRHLKALIAGWEKVEPHVNDMQVDQFTRTGAQYDGPPDFADALQAAREYVSLSMGEGFGSLQPEDRASVPGQTEAAAGASRKGPQ